MLETNTQFWPKLQHCCVVRNVGFCCNSVENAPFFLHFRCASKTLPLDQANWTCKPMFVFTILHKCCTSFVEHHILQTTNGKKTGCMDDDCHKGHKSNYQGLPLKTLVEHGVLDDFMLINTLDVKNVTKWESKIKMFFLKPNRKNSCFFFPLQRALANSKKLRNFPDGLLPPLDLLCSRHRTSCCCRCSLKNI